MFSDRLGRRDDAPAGRPITGRAVLIAMLAFFGVVVGVNVVMVRLATATFGGLETDSAYRAGLRYNKEAAAAAAQNARGWTVEASVLRSEGQDARVVMTAFDREGLIVPGLEGEVRLARPADRRMDRTAPIAFTGGRYEAAIADAPAGQWDLVIALQQKGERVFFSRSRLMLP